MAHLAHPVQPDLFAAPAAAHVAEFEGFDDLEAPEFAEPHPALAELEALDPDALTPRQALDALFALKALLK